MSGQIQNLLGQSLIARSEHRPADALRALVEAVQLCREQHGAPLLLAKALTALGQIERDLNDPENAIQHYGEAAAIYRTGEPLKLAHTIRHIGDIHQHEKRLGEAEAYYRESLAIYRAHPEASVLDVANAIRGFALLKGSMGETDQAKALWEEARELYARVNVEAGVADSTRRIAALNRE